MVNLIVIFSQIKIVVVFLLWGCIAGLLLLVNLKLVKNSRNKFAKLYR